MESLYLICDDDEINNFILKRLIEKVVPDAIVMELDTGMDCIEAYISCRQANYVPAAVFLDQNMPRMRGTDVARVLREEQSNKPVESYEGPIYLVTAEMDLENFRRTGLFTQVIPKPLTKKIVEELLIH